MQLVAGYNGDGDLVQGPQMAPSPERAHVNLAVIATNLEQYGRAVSKMKPNRYHSEMSLALGCAGTSTGFKC